MRPELLRELAGPVGRLEARLIEPAGPPRAVAVLAHPHPLHGGSLQSKALYQAAEALGRVGVAALRFNFRGVGLSDGRFDGGPGEMDDYRAALEAAASRYPGLPLWAGGFSFGAWVSWNVALDDPRVPILIGIGVPVTRFDFSPVAASRQAKVLIHGEMDTTVPVRDIRRFYAQLREPKELVLIDGADHVFDGKTSELGEAVEELLGGGDGFSGTEPEENV